MFIERGRCLREESMVKRWNTTFSLNGSAIERAFISLDDGQIVVAGGDSEERFDLAEVSVSYSRWVSPAGEYIGSIATIASGDATVRLGGTSLLPDHRYVSRPSSEMDMVLSGQDFLDLVSILDEAELVEKDEGSPYRDAPHARREEYTLPLTVSPWTGAWKFPVFALLAMLGLTSVGVTVISSVQGGLSFDAIAYSLTGAGLLFAIAPFGLARWLKMKAPARLVIAGRELRLEAASEERALASSNVDDIDFEPLEWVIPGAPSQRYAGLRVAFPGREELTIGSSDDRSRWTTSAESYVAPKYTIGRAGFEALASYFGLTESLRSDNDRWVSI